METFTAIIEKEEDMYVATCSEVGTVSQGKTIEEAIENLKESTSLYLEEFPIEEKSKPLITTFEITINNVKSQKNIGERMHQNSL